MSAVYTARVPQVRRPSRTPSCPASSWLPRAPAASRGGLKWRPQQAYPAASTRRQLVQCAAERSTTTTTTTTSQASQAPLTAIDTEAATTRISTQPQSPPSVAGLGASKKSARPDPGGARTSDLPSALARVVVRSSLYVIRRFSWGSLRLDVLATNLLAILGVILVNYGVESILDHYLGDSPLGSLACILFGAGVMVYVKLYRVRVAGKLMVQFWN